MGNRGKQRFSTGIRAFPEETLGPSYPTLRSQQGIFRLNSCLITQHHNIWYDWATEHNISILERILIEQAFTSDAISGT